MRARAGDEREVFRFPASRAKAEKKKSKKKKRTEKGRLASRECRRELRIILPLVIVDLCAHRTNRHPRACLERTWGPTGVNFGGEFASSFEVKRARNPLERGKRRRGRGERFPTGKVSAFSLSLSLSLSLFLPFGLLSARVRRAVCFSRRALDRGKSLEAGDREASQRAALSPRGSLTSPPSPPTPTDFHPPAAAPYCRSRLD